MVDLKEFTSEMFHSDEIRGLRDFLALVKVGEPWEIGTELLIRLNGNRKRGKYVNQQINDALKEHGLVCAPVIDTADYYGTVIVSDPRDEITRGGMVSLPLSAFPSDFEDLISCGREMSVSKLLAIMVGSDISQVPVLSSNKNTVYGVVTWKSIALSYKGGDAKAEQVMSSAGHVASSGDDFLELIDTIIGQEFILYRLPDGRINGIVTASDLARAFDGSAGTYIRLQEIESRLRVLLDRAKIPQLQGHLEKRRRDKAKFRGATDMMFGEYLDALKDEKIWAATRIAFDHESCLKIFNDVRDVRNGVMHFSTKSEEEEHADGAMRMPETKDELIIARALRILRAVPID